jgi:hypothetical protein
MVHEKWGSKEDSVTKEPKKCKSHLFKEAYDLPRKTLIHKLLIQPTQHPYDRGADS